MFSMASNDAKLVSMTSCDQPSRKNPHRELPKIASRLVETECSKSTCTTTLHPVYTSLRFPASIVAPCVRPNPHRL